MTSKVCDRCGYEFDSTTPASSQAYQFLKKTYFECICAKCLSQVDQLIASIEGETFPISKDQREGFHFYKENGLFVFTEQYHLLRGSCCKSGCRHCPYGFKRNVFP